MEKPKPGFPGKTLIIVGVLLTGASLVLNLRVEGAKFSLFILIGVGMVGYGLFKIYFLEKQEADLKKIRGEHGSGYAVQGHAKPGHHPQAGHAHHHQKTHPPGTHPAHHAQHPHPVHQGHQQQPAVTCTRCGNHLPQHARYCSQCGKKR